MDKKSLNEKQLEGAKDRNCKVATSPAFSEVSTNKQKNQRNISTKLHVNYQRFLKNNMDINL